MREERRAEGRGKKQNKKQGQEEMSTTDKRETQEAGKRRVKRTNAKRESVYLDVTQGKGMGSCD